MTFTHWNWIWKRFNMWLFAFQEWTFMNFWKSRKGNDVCFMMIFPLSSSRWREKYGAQQPDLQKLLCEFFELECWWKKFFKLEIIQLGIHKVTSDDTETNNLVRFLFGLFLIFLIPHFCYNIIFSLWNTRPFYFHVWARELAYLTYIFCV